MNVLSIEEDQSGTGINPAAEVSNRQEIVVPEKHDISSLMLALKEEEIKSEGIPVHMDQEHIETKQEKDNNETLTVMVHKGQINKTTTLTVTTEEEWRQATLEDHDII